MDMDATLDNVIFSYNHKEKNNCEILNVDFLIMGRMLTLINDNKNILLSDKPKHITFEMVNKKSQLVKTIHIINVSDYEFYGSTEDGRVIISFYFEKYIID